ncbi:MAG: biotin--[acetyl-CoA-carboxylase] ligase [Verrucomicrobiota bacterium]|nr:biotin--[acetyl-CoA-carboxylase] ligase [Verrucomicrobiota bacterium]
MSAADVAILRALREQPTRPTRALDLANRAALTTGELADAIADLRAAGYAIGEPENGTYLFGSAPDRLIAGDLRAGIDDGLIGGQIIVLEQTGSTNEFLLAMAGPQIAEGFVVFAEEQTAGRGQHGKRWASAARRGLWFSILLRPRISLAESARLTSWIAGCVADTLGREFSLHASVKSPNDVYIGDRKVAGVLVEMRAAEKSHFAIAGIGINATQQIEDFPPELRETASSLAMICGHPIDRRDLAVAVLRDLDRTYREIFVA